MAAVLIAVAFTDALKDTVRSTRKETDFPDYCNTYCMSDFCLPLGSAKTQSQSSTFPQHLQYE